ncbi:MAG: PilC/PilY family type IV pilus protein [Ramlibacter sp.]|uniref:pilus assembly protein n=1 Tax=Ramlibacter sp. TaxID=1917967 RepID=UPI0026042E07|nr:PilC/PilY family type IV pilus protein [Ramlibacter sp.]MDH4378042.1 PilC/PilY family type IV pilus protein [Ramlibacter sp.]
MRRLIHQILGVGLSLLAALSAVPAASQYTSDIDLYAGQTTSAGAANVLIIMDNTANWSSMFAREMTAVGDTIAALPSNQFNVGLMMFTETGSGNTGADGGYVRAAIRPLDDTYKQRLRSLVTSLSASGDRSNNGKAALSMAEAWYYFASRNAVSGRTKTKTDYRGNTSGSSQSNAIYAMTGNALDAVNATRYNGPTVTNCGRNYIIYVSNGSAQDNASDSSAASTALSAAYTAMGMTRPADITGLSPSGSQSNMADEWARFMRASPQGITTYTLDIDPVTNGQGPGWSALLTSMANRSGGQYFNIDSTVNNGGRIVDALQRIFNQIQAVNSVFTSASLPVSMTTRGTYQNQVFLGMFRPDQEARPRWRGNLKQYRFDYNPLDGSVRLVDAAGEDAVTGTTGFISPNAASYWTADSNFWVNQAMGTPASTSDRPDGEVVEKGGAAQRQRLTYATSQTTRKVFTCLGCAAQPTSPITLATSSAHQFVDGNASLTAATLGAASAAARTALINWVRGTDNAGDETGPGGTTTVRPSIHGDVLHSRPAVVNYGGSTGVVVFYGSNDGMLRAVNGNASGTGAGDELWSFIPSEHLARLKRLRDNAPEIRLSTTVVPTQPGTTAPTPRDYFVDGPIGIYQRLNTAGTSDRVILFVGMRRGGRELYALDVTTPSSPVYLWKHTSANLPVLGQTWSEPRVARLKGRTDPVIVMGAGYDNVAEDQPTPGTTTMGNAVLVLDAFTGAVLRRFDTSRSVAADVALVDADYDGYIDRAYAADVGGNIYRLDFEKETTGGVLAGTDDWGMYAFATLGGTSSPVRKFFYSPDVVLNRTFAAVLAGSGDREKPLSTTSNDRFFTLIDTRLTKGTPTGAVTPLVPGDLVDVASGLASTRGCYISLDGVNGEKVVNAPTTVGGVTYFATHRPTRPAANSCAANLGQATSYAAPVLCKAATSANIRGGGLAPSVVAGTALVQYRDPTTGETLERAVDFRIGGPNAKESAIEASGITGTISSTRRRRYWFLENAR